MNKNPPQPVPQRKAEAPLKRLSYHRRDPLRVITRLNFELVRLNQGLPILLNHGLNLIRQRNTRRLQHVPGGVFETRLVQIEPRLAPSAIGKALSPNPTFSRPLRPAAACAGGSRYAGSASHRESL